MLFKKSFLKSDISNIIKDNYIKLLDTYAKNNFYEKIVKESFISINNLDKEKYQKYIDYIKLVDKKYNDKTNDEISTKLNSIMVGAIYIDKYSDLINDLSYEQLAVLSNYSACCDIDDLELIAKKFNKNIMDSVFAKTKDSKVASEILEVLEYKNFDNDSEAISYIESVSIEDVVKQFLDIMSDYGLYIMNKVGDDDESRRIRL